MLIGMQDKHEISSEEKRTVSLTRAAELRREIRDYEAVKQTIKTGFDLQDIIDENKKRLLCLLNATEDNWKNWRWQMANRINEAGLLSKFLNLNKTRCEQINEVSKHYRWAVSPYFASLINPGVKNDPVMLQSVPSIEELDEAGYDDPMAEEFTSPAPCVTRRYPDRLIINVTNQCAMYCRHCQRRRNIGESDRHQSKSNLTAALDYIRQNKEIRDVLITGGDALLLADSTIDWLLTELDNIRHVEIKRLGTRTLVTLPQRITPELCAVLKKHPPIYMNTQFNHPQIITPESKLACDMLSDAGVVLGNQSVLLKGINNDPCIMKKLNQELLKIRVKPYYLFHAKAVKGTTHFITSMDEGIEIIKKLRGYTSGLAVPTYIVNAPNGYGKVPIMPEYVVHRDSTSAVLRTWEGKELKVPFDLK